MNGYKCKLLLVDDSEDDAILIRIAFRKVGREDCLFWVPSGTQAMDYLAGNGLYADRAKFPLPDVILLDLQMPEMDGYVVLKWVKANVLFKSIPVIVFSGSPLIKDIDLAYELGANSYVTKPVEFDRLSEDLAEVANFWLDCCRLPLVTNP